MSRFDDSGLAVFYSENATPDCWLRAPLKTSAEEFHRVQRELFRSGPIIPFRFLTILQSQEKLREHSEQRAEEYKALLHRHADDVQMDISLTYGAVASKPTSGADYLRERHGRNQALENFAAKLRAAAGTLAEDWRQRSTPNGIRCFALVARKQVEEFNEKMKNVSVPPQISARVSGPWPVSEFLDFAT